MIYSYGFYFGQPWWLVFCILLVPILWLGRRNLAALGTIHRTAAIVLRCLAVFILVAMLAEPMLTKQNQRLSVIAVIDRSQSIPEDLQAKNLDYLKQALKDKPAEDLFAAVDVAERADISKLPSGDVEIPRRNTTLTGLQSRLEDGIEMAMAIAPPDTATRILLISEGNQTAGDIKEAAIAAAANGIPIDVLPVSYNYINEVVFKSLIAPAHARSNQTISLRFILNSTAYAKGRIQLNLNGKAIDLVPDSPDVAAPVELNPGTNVKTVSVPLGGSGLHEFEAVYIPDDISQDRIDRNNRASAITYVAGRGKILIVDNDGLSGKPLYDALQNTDMDINYISGDEFPDNLTRLIDIDAIVLANTDCSAFTYRQQEMLSYYVTELGGGLIMSGGPESFGAGGWIGSPVAGILPVELDPPEKQQLPKGAIVLIIDHSGSMTGEKVEMCKVAAVAAVRLLSQRDMAGVVVFDGASQWQVPLAPAADKEEINRQIRSIGAGGGTIMGPAMEMAFNSLKGVEAGIKHIILLTDGQTSDEDFCRKIKSEIAQSKISVSTVAVGPEVNERLLSDIADDTGGRFYRVADPMSIPEIFVKEAQVVRRSMIVERTFLPQIVSGFSEILKGLSMEMPVLDGYIYTGDKGGLNQVILKSDKNDPVFAICQAGMGRCAAFTSSTDSRWALSWLQWGGFARFWEQTVRWAAKPAYSTDIEVFTDVQGQQTTVEVEAVDDTGKFMQFANIDAQVISPEVSTETVELTQTGPGQYSGLFKTAEPGSYIVNVRYKQTGENAQTQSAISAVTIPFAPEFRDLTDNEPLLEQVSKITGGRILNPDPNRADLFDYTGLKFPMAQTPLIRPLMLIWLALFLLDVAVRRVTLDIRASIRKMFLWIRRGRRKRKTDKTIETLKRKRHQVQKQMFTKPAEVRDLKFEISDFNFSKLPPDKDTTKSQNIEIKNEKPESKEELSHIQKLIIAKRKAGITPHTQGDEKEK
jgi:Ca-activated chloride channel homolog